MAIVAIIAFVLLILAVPAILINRDLLGRKLARRRKRHDSTMPFLVFPTTGHSANPLPVPAWYGTSGTQGAPQGTRGAAVAPATPIRPEPGIADLPLQPEPGIADLPPREMARDTLWGRTVPSDASDEPHLDVDDSSHS